MLLLFLLYVFDVALLAPLQHKTHKAQLTHTHRGHTERRPVSSSPPPPTHSASLLAFLLFFPSSFALSTHQAGVLGRKEPRGNVRFAHSLCCPVRSLRQGTQYFAFKWRKSRMSHTGLGSVRIWKVKPLSKSGTGKQEEQERAHTASVAVTTTTTNELLVGSCDTVDCRLGKLVEAVIRHEPIALALKGEEGREKNERERESVCV